MIEYNDKESKFTKPIILSHIFTYLNIYYYSWSSLARSFLILRRSGLLTPLCCTTLWFSPWITIKFPTKVVTGLDGYQWGNDDIKVSKELMALKL
jgi:hypothetical protein